MKLGIRMKVAVFNRAKLIPPPQLRSLVVAVAFLLSVAMPWLAAAKEKEVLQYGEGLIVNIPSPEAEVVPVVEEVAQNTLIRGTKEYNKDEFIGGATAAASTSAFPAWTEGGRVFYKVRAHALNPLNFKNTNDTGTLAVRYVVQPQGESNTVLRINAIYVEDFRHAIHQSNGSVEGSEYKDIQDRLQAVALLKKETAEALEAKQERAAKQKFGVNAETTVLSTPAAGSESNEPAKVPAPAPDNPELESGISLEQHIADLRREVQRLVKQPGAPLKSAPFRTASTLTSLDPGAEVLILISTRYWYGVETHDGQHGWLRRDQLEETR